MNLFGKLLVLCFYVTGEVRFSTKLWPNDTEASTDMTQLFCICHQNFYRTNWKWLSFVIEFIKIDLVLMNVCGYNAHTPYCLHSNARAPFSFCLLQIWDSGGWKKFCVLNPFRVNGIFSELYARWAWNVRNTKQEPNYYHFREYGNRFYFVRLVFFSFLKHCVNFSSPFLMNHTFFNLISTSFLLFHFVTLSV